MSITLITCTKYLNGRSKGYNICNTTVFDVNRMRVEKIVRI